MISLAPAPYLAQVTRSTCAFTEVDGVGHGDRKTAKTQERQIILRISYAYRHSRRDPQLDQRCREPRAFIDPGRKHHHRLTIEHDVQP